MFKKLLAGRQPSRLGDIPVVFDIFIFLNGANVCFLVTPPRLASGWQGSCSSANIK
jgi:hypothetical protein